MFLFWFLIWYSIWRHYFAVATDTITSCSLGRRYWPVFSLSFLDVYGLVLLVAITNNALGRGSASSKHITKLEQSRFSLDIYDRNTHVGVLSFISHSWRHCWCFSFIKHSWCHYWCCWFHLPFVTSLLVSLAFRDVIVGVFSFIKHSWCHCWCCWFHLPFVTS